jgi:hypothetical protein
VAENDQAEVVQESEGALSKLKAELAQLQTSSQESAARAVQR